MDEFFSDDLREVIAVSRQIALEWNHGFINYDHFFVAMLKVKCLAADYIPGYSLQEWNDRIGKLHAAGEFPSADETLPLTVHAERVVLHAIRLTAVNNEEKTNSVHLLLSILSYQNPISFAFSKSGVLFEDISEHYYNKPVKLFSPEIKPINNKPFTSSMLFFMSESSKKKKVKLLIQNAHDLHMYGQYNDCINVCRIGLTLEPVNEEFQTFLIHCYIRQRDFKKAVEVSTKLVLLKPENLGYQFTLSFIYSELEDYDRSAVIADALLAQQPNVKEFLNNKGFGLLKQEQFAAAIPFFEKAILADSEFAFAWDNLGYAKFKLGQIAEGLSMINKSLELDKGNSYAYKCRGLVYLKQGDKAEALKNFKAAAKFHYKEKYGDEVDMLLEQLGE